MLQTATASISLMEQVLGQVGKGSKDMKAATVSAGAAILAFALPLVQIQSALSSNVVESMKHKQWQVSRCTDTNAHAVS